jgi:CheY-like chemotaxis protein
MMGVEATRVIRQVLQYKGLIFGVTGNALEEDIKLFQTNGADEVIIKPLTKQKFVAVVIGRLTSVGSVDSFNQPEVGISHQGLRCSTVTNVAVLKNRSSEDFPLPSPKMQPRVVQFVTAVETTKMKKSMNVLIVDDSAMVRKVTGQVVRSRGHAFSEAVDGDQAVDMVRQSLSEGPVFDVILMDNQVHPVSHWMNWQ